MKLHLILLLGTLLAAACRERVPAPEDAAPEKPAAGAATNKPAAATFGSAVVDVITQRDKIEAGRQAKAVIEASAARENKAIQETLEP